MYTNADARKIYEKRRKIQAELLLSEAMAYRNEQAENSHIYTQIRAFKQQLMIIDSCFSLLTENQAFLINAKVYQGLDWQQVCKLYTDKWGTSCEKNQRTYQNELSEALKVTAHFMRTHPNVPWKALICNQPMNLDDIETSSEQ